MEIHVVAHHEIAVRAGVTRAVGTELMTRNLAEVEERGEEVVLVTRAELGALVTTQAARRAGAELHERMRQLGAGAFHAAVVERAVFLAEDRAVAGVADAVAATGLGEINERAGEDHFALSRKRDADRIVHAAGHHHVEVGAVRFRAVDVRGAILQHAAVAERVRLLIERALGPVEIAIRPKIRAVNVVRAAGQRPALEPFLALVSHAIAVGVGELPDAGRSGDVNGAVMPEAALRKHHLAGKDGGLVERAVAVNVFKAEHAMRRILELLGGFVVRSGRISDIEPALVIKARTDRARYLISRGDALDGEPLRHRELVGANLELRGVHLGNQRDDGDDGEEGE